MMMHDLIVLALMATSGVSLLILLGLQACTHATLSRKERSAKEPAPPISILKPLRGVDDGLEANLLSLVDQQYPCFEVLLAAEDAADPALEIARRVQRNRPHRCIRILAGTRPRALNPKVSNLIALTEQAAYGTSHVGPSAATTVLLGVGGVALKCVADNLVTRRLRGKGFGLVSIAWIPLKDVLAFGIWAAAHMPRSVTWREHHFRLLAGSRVAPWAARPADWADAPGREAA